MIGIMVDGGVEVLAGGWIVFACGTGMPCAESAAEM